MCLSSGPVVPMPIIFDPTLPISRVHQVIQHKWLAARTPRRNFSGVKSEVTSIFGSVGESQSPIGSRTYSPAFAANVSTTAIFCSSSCGKLCLSFRYSGLLYETQTFP